MRFWKRLRGLPAFPSIAITGAVLMTALLCHGASGQSAGAGSDRASAVSFEDQGESSSLAATAGFERRASGPADPGLPSAPEPAANPDHPAVPWAAVWNQPRFSRMSIGADFSPLGIGLKGAIVLNRLSDLRVTGNFLPLNVGPFEIEGFKTDVNIHMVSASASLDVYPYNSVVRISPGLMFYNGNQVTVTADILPGTNFTLNGHNYWSASANAATGATPLSGSGVLGLDTHKVAPTVSFGFGRFIPRSNRHWSFPSEFGVAWTGAPTADISTSGWVCLDQAQTQCSNLSDASNPVTAQFNSSLQSALTKWRSALAKVPVFPIVSSSVVYSFNLRQP
jgi:hypothetical protein